VVSSTAAPKVVPPATATSAPPQQTQQLATVQTPETQVVKKTIIQRIWAELVHYYHGFRLLFIDINVCRKLLWRILNGHSLTRREHRLLVRTTSDLFRLVPFSVFIIVPFMELLLPVAIKLFPGMLPSTFQSASEQETKIKQNLKMKIEMAKFLQKTLDDMAVQAKDHQSEAAKEFNEFFHKIRTSGDVTAAGEDIMKFSKLFEDEITLDSLSRQQLLALCRVLEATTIGTNAFLRFQLRMKLRSLAADDRVIQKEGIDALNLSELQSACRARGMRAYGISEERLRAQLQEWINLSLNEKVPPSLLLMSRALLMPENLPTSDKLKATISALPDSVVTQTKAAIGEREGKIDNKTKIDVIKDEVRKIREEREEQKQEEKEIKAKEQQKQQEQDELLVDQAPIVTSEGIVKPTPEDITKMFVEQQIVKDQEKKFGEGVVPEVSELSSSDLKVVGDALETLGDKKKKMMVEKKEIEEIKEEIADYKEDVQELNEIVEMKKDEKIKETIAAKLLYRKVNQMINKLDGVLGDLEKKEQALKKDLLPAEAASSTEVPAEGESDPKLSEELVRIDEVMEAIRKVSCGLEFSK
jgi:LETM1 and EF-hand domain-containing protein 1